jgi:hypothetical protein
MLGIYGVIWVIRAIRVITATLPTQVIVIVKFYQGYYN